MQPTYPTEPTPIKLADGQERHLRYSLGAVKRIKAKFGKEPLEVLKTPAEELLPYVLMEGLIEKDGITEQRLLEDEKPLITGPMIDYVTFCFVEAFFGQRAKSALELFYQNQDAILARLAKPEPTPTDPTVQ